MTEDEAKTKWCPHSREKGSNIKSSNWNRLNVQHKPQQISLCLGSECMAWRHSKDLFMVKFNGNAEEEWAWNPQGMRDGDKLSSYYALSKVRIVKTGYCGLAGKP